MRFLMPLFVVAAGILSSGCATQVSAQQTKTNDKPVANFTSSAKGEKWVLGSGCFWCIEAQLESLKGVKDVVSGYAGGTVANPTYDMVMSGATGHAEVVEVTFDPKVISREEMLRIFFVSHDPTQLNRQGNDVGTQYRSSIFYRTPEEKAMAEKVKAALTKDKLFERPIVTTIEPLTVLYRAEEYHQDYYAKFEKASEAEKAKMNAGYCTYVVSPKLGVPEEVRAPAEVMERRVALGIVGVCRVQLGAPSGLAECNSALRYVLPSITRRSLRER